MTVRELKLLLHSLSASSAKRQTVQITSHFDATGRYFVLALCNDGTLWKLSGLYEGEPVWDSFPVPPAVPGIHPDLEAIRQVLAEMRTGK